jgi:hypothetical protein
MHSSQKNHSRLLLSDCDENITKPPRMISAWRQIGGRPDVARIGRRCSGFISSRGTCQPTARRGRLRVACLLLPGGQRGCVLPVSPAFQRASDSVVMYCIVTGFLSPRKKFDISLNIRTSSNRNFDTFY